MTIYQTAQFHEMMFTYSLHQALTSRVAAREIPLNQSNSDSSGVGESLTSVTLFQWSIHSKGERGLFLSKVSTEHNAAVSKVKFNQVSKVYVYNL